MTSTRRRGLAAAAAASVALAAVALLGVAPTARAAAPPPGQWSRYTMTAFTNSSESNMYVYEAPDATGFRLLRGPAFTPPSGLIRDPSIIRHTDGRYYVVYTTNWTGNTIGFATSTDRVNWTFLRNHTIPLAGVQRTWAPEWFVDNGTVNIIVSLSTNGTTFMPYRLTATNSGLTAFSNPAVLSGLGPNYIDTFLVRIGSTYHAFTKNETTKFIEYATASSLTGPYTFRRTGNWAGWGGPNEGQALVPLDNGGWRIYFDGYTIGQYFFSDSYDTFNTWSARQQLPGLTGFARHFTVLKETVGGGVTLPVNTTRSFRSVNFPDRYASNRGNLGYVDPVSSSSTAAVKQAANLAVVPGLADANCYSFTNAGRYLRHYNFRARFDPNDGTATFRGDATFCPRPGSAGGSVALESYNFPGRYLRHYNYELRVELYADNATFRADSSFTPVAAWT
jgi:hypothetical protein